MDEEDGAVDCRVGDCGFGRGLDLVVGGTRGGDVEIISDFDFGAMFTRVLVPPFIADARGGEAATARGGDVEVVIARGGEDGPTISAALENRTSR